MRRPLLLMAALLSLALPSLASTTTVTGTIVDPNGNPYANGTIGAALNFNTGQSPTTPGGLVVLNYGPGALDASGHFAIVLTDTSTITPAGSTYQFTACAQSMNLGPAVQRVPVCFTTGQFTITGGSVDISAQLNALAPIIGPGSGSNSRVSPNQAAFYASPNCGSQANCYPVVADDSTDNAADFAALASAVNAATRKTVNTQPQPITVVLATGTYKYSSGLAFTKPVDLVCLGSVLDYSGSAHAVDVGPSGLVNGTLQSGDYTVDGCTFTGGATMTEGIFANQFIVNLRLFHNTFRNFGGSSSARVYLDGDNWDSLIQSNTWIDDDNTLRGNTFFANNRDANTQTRFIGNLAVCWNGPTPTAGCTTPGAGFASGGVGSQFIGNNIAFFAPNVIIPQVASATRLVNNYTEENVASTALPDIQFGSSSDTGNLDGLYVSGLYVNQHTNNSPFGPGSATMGLSNASIFGVYVVGLGTAKVVAQNNITGQTGNTFGAISPLFDNTVAGNINAWAGIDLTSGNQILYNTAWSPIAYTVATLPSAATLGAGSSVMVSDANSFTPGACTGGGTDYMIAVSNGTTWSCH